MTLKIPTRIYVKIHSTYSDEPQRRYRATNAEKAKKLAGYMEGSELIVEKTGEVVYSGNYRVYKTETPYD